MAITIGLIAYYGRKRHISPYLATTTPQIVCTGQIQIHPLWHQYLYTTEHYCVVRDSRPDFSWPIRFCGNGTSGIVNVLCDRLTRYSHASKLGHTRIISKKCTERQRLDARWCTPHVVKSVRKIWNNILATTSSRAISHVLFIRLPFTIPFLFFILQFPCDPSPHPYWFLVLEISQV